RLVHAIDTHTHADHITALGDLRDATACTTIMGERSRAECVSRQVRDGELLRVDGITLQALYTPGHTDESFSFVLEPATPRAVFTGDVLLVRSTGRTDFQAGDAGLSWHSIVDRLFALPDDTTVYPAHDYKGWTASSIGEEKRHNPRLAGKTQAEYVEIMRNLNLPNPRLMDVAIPANLACGQAPGLA
uniref:MBL fold metallo-hydrolase n=1 Tax=Pigmentiphaga sp. TaxID=1977564 RepID=UPI0025D85DF0